MLYVYQLDIAAVMLTLTVLFIFCVRRNYPTKNSRIFMTILIFMLVAEITDILSCFTISYPYDYPLYVNYIINILCLLFQNMTNVAYYFYITSIMKEGKITLFDKVLGYGCVIGIALLLFTTPFTHWMIYFDENRRYCAGPLKVVLYAVFVVVLLLGVRQFFVRHKFLGQFQRITVMMYNLLLSVAIVVQYFHQNFLLVLFVCSILLLMVFLSLENPLDYMYENTTCYNMKAFLSTIEAKISNKEDFTVVTFSFADGEYIMKYLGYWNLNELIRQIIRRLHKDYRYRDVFYIGEYRFAILIHKRTNVEKIIDELRKSFEKTIHFENVSTSLKLYFVVLHYPEFVQDTEEVMYAINYYYKKRDFLYEGKIVTATKEALTSRQREADVLYILRNAIANDSFQIYFQPIYHEKSGEYASAEALVRLYDEEIGFIPPDEFIPLAEQYGLISELGDVILRKVFSFVGKKNLKKLGVNHINVNLSMMQCMQFGFAEHLKQMMHEYEIPGDRIKYEITESISVTNQSTVHNMMQQMIAFGTEFYLDDYGTGFSTATYLIDLPFTCIKVDKSILWQAVKNEDAMLVLKNIIGMIKDLKKGCLVEGIENEEMEVLLRGLGCDCFQGYHFSKPLPEKEFIQFVMANNS